MGHFGPPGSGSVFLMRIRIHKTGPIPSCRAVLRCCVAWHSITICCLAWLWLALLQVPLRWFALHWICFLVALICSALNLLSCCVDFIGYGWNYTSKVYLGSCVQLYLLAETPHLPPPPAFGIIYEGVIDRRHLFVTHRLIGFFCIEFAFLLRCFALHIVCFLVPLIALHWICFLVNCDVRFKLWR